MKRHDLSLVHNVRTPERAAGGRAPLLLLLHGIGSNEDDLFGLAPYLDPRFLVVSARAPLALEWGGYGWFNIEFTPRGIVADIEQAGRSRELLLKFLGELIETYDADPACVHLGGFSQGAMMSLAIALTRPDLVAGVAALSGRLPAQLVEQAASLDAVRGLRVYVAHGLHDQVIPVEYGRACRDALQQLPLELTYREYPMAHEVTMESLRDVSAWLTTSLDECGKE